METIKSVAALKRIPPGTKLRLVLGPQGPCDKKRVFKAARSADVIMTKEDGRDSYLTLRGCKIEATDRGFRVSFDDGAPGMLEYVFD